MKNYFKSFYMPTEQALEEAWFADGTIFTFDTNVFLNLYSYADQTREDFFCVLEKIRDKVWIPYHVGLEYEIRRLKVIKNEKYVFEQLGRALDKIEKTLEDDIKELLLEKRFPKLHENTERFKKEIIKNINSYKKSVAYWDGKQPCVRSHDFIREKLNEIFENRVGDPPGNQGELDEIFAEGVKRYQDKVPPGYKDNGKSTNKTSHYHFDSLKYERQYGDLIIWKQIIKKAEDQNIKRVILVTDDNKEDWWYQIESRGKKTIGPHAELQCEIFKQTGIDLFFMYNTSSFLENGKKILDIGVHESSIKDAEEKFYDRENLEISKVFNEKFLKQYKEQEIQNYNKALADIATIRSYREDGQGSEIKRLSEYYSNKIPLDELRLIEENEREKINKMIFNIGGQGMTIGEMIEAEKNKIKPHSIRVSDISNLKSITEQGIKERIEFLDKLEKKMREIQKIDNKD